MNLKKKITKSFQQVFFVVVNGGRGIDTNRILTQFLFPMSWSKINFLKIWLFPIIRYLTREYIQGKHLEDDTINCISF
jgi:hypothetical protein